MNRLFAGIFFLLIASVPGGCAKKSSEPWEPEQLMPPEELAAILNDPAADRPLIICIGPGALIEGSQDVGQTGEEPNLEKLRTLLSDKDRGQELVIYCGCCPFEKCPNIRPAFTLLNDMGFTEHRLLNLSTNLKTDWIGKGYPVGSIE